MDSIVKQRHSVRSYTDKKIEGEVLKELETLIEKINKEANLNFKLILNEPKVFNSFMAHYGKFNNVNNYIPLIGPKGKDLEEKCGYYGEMIALKAQELGLNTCFVALTYGKRNIPYKLENNEKIACTLTIGYGANQGVKHKIKSLEEVSITKDNLPEWYKKGIEYALLAPTAMNQQKFTIELLENNIVKIEPGKGFYTKVDLGIVKYNFELGAKKENFTWAK